MNSKDKMREKRMGETKIFDSELLNGATLTGELSFNDRVTGKRHSWQLTDTHQKLQTPAIW